MARELISKKYLLLAALCILKFSLHLATNHMYGFHRDEFLYMDYSHHLDFGFYDLPPLTPVFAWISRTLFDESVFSLRLLPALSGSGTLLLAGLIVLELGGSEIALFLTGLSIICSAMLRVDTLMQPVTFDVFFWTLCTYLLIRYLSRNHPKDLLWLGLAFALGALNKYNIFLWLTGIVTGLLIFNRDIFKKKELLQAIGLSFLIVLPNLCWQISHGLPGIGHVKALSREQFINVSKPEIIISQFIFFGPGFILWIAGLISVFRRSRRNLRAIGVLYFVAIMVLLIFRGKSYYALGLYPALIAIGAVYVEEVSQRGIGLILAPLLALVIVSFGILFFPGAVPVLSPGKLTLYCAWLNKTLKVEIRRWEDGKIHKIPQDFADMYGWQECGQKMAYWYFSIPEKERADYVLSGSSYGSSAAVDYYCRKHHIPEVYNGSSGMLNWVPASIHAHKIVYIGDNQAEDLRYFKTVKIVDSIVNPNARIKGTYIIIASDCREDLPALWQRVFVGLKAKGPFEH